MSNGIAAGDAATLTIDLAALAGNWRRLRDRARPAECAAVVKADAYGIGIEAVVPALWRAGCRTFFVAHLSEAREVREVSGRAAVYVLNGLPPGAAAEHIALGSRPVLGSRDEIAEWGAFARHVKQAVPPAAIHVDTGMNRLGLPLAEARALLGNGGAALGFPVGLLMSHLVSSEEPDNPLNARQAEAFAAIRALVPEIPASLCNSSGIFLPGQPVHDLVRPGYALYGGNPTPGRENPMAPVVRLEAPILQVRTIGPGDTVGYNAQWTAPGPRRVATLSLGYADGWPRAETATDAKPGGMALVHGVPCPFAGRVSMDLVTLDVTAVPEGAVRRGDRAVLLGDGLTIDAVGARAGTIGYEVLTSLGRRYRRVCV